MTLLAAPHSWFAAQRSGVAAPLRAAINFTPPTTATSRSLSGIRMRSSPLDSQPAGKDPVAARAVVKEASAEGAGLHTSATLRRCAGVPNAVLGRNNLQLGGSNPARCPL